MGEEHHGKKVSCYNFTIRKLGPVIMKKLFSLENGVSYILKKIIENLDSEVLNYHWNNRDKFERDYQYLLNFYEKTLKIISLKDE